MNRKTERGQLLTRASSISNVFRILDVAAIGVCGVVVYYVQAGTPLPERYVLILSLLVLLSTIAFSWVGVYDAWRGRQLGEEIKQLTKGFASVLLAVATLMFFTKTSESFSRLWFGYTFVTSFILISLTRALIRVFLRSLRDIGFNQKRVVIVGAGPLGKRAARAMLEQTWAGLNPVGFFDDKQSLVGQTDRGVEVLGPISQLASHIEERRNEGRPIDQAWIALPLTQNKRIAEIQTSLQDTSTDVYFVPDLFGFDLASYRVDEIVGLPVMNMSAKNVHGVKALVKRIEDIFLSSILLILLSPLLLILAGLVKISSPGPILFKQRRYGQNGREILVWKFRSMTVADDGDSIAQAKRNDERVTKVGKWLRKLSLDELPQLFNVLQGSMSLVGPRPHAVAHNELYRKKVPGYMIRHQIRPGITGWAQVNGCRGETSKLSDMEERIRYDIDYIRDWSILLDIRILFRTIRVVLKSADVY